jgi:hypothetical protein
MELTLSTPALLFSAISLILLAYTNRFLSLAQLVRNLHDQFKQNHDCNIYNQITNLRKRLYLIRTMQIAGLVSLLLCVLCMFFIYIGLHLSAEILFGIALISLTISLCVSIWEIQISVHALNLHLSNIEDEKNHDI